MRYVVAILLLALTMPARAESANQMLSGCKSLLDNNMTGVPMPNKASCAGFLDGLAFGIEGRDFCPPREVTSGQMVAVIVKYIEARPERMNEQFGLFALEALTAAWPCKR